MEISKDLIRGHTDTIILNILNQGDSYGYQVSKSIRQLSDHQYELNEATLYTAFRRLEKLGDIEKAIGVTKHKVHVESITVSPHKGKTI